MEILTKACEARHGLLMSERLLEINSEVNRPNNVENKKHEIDFQENFQKTEDFRKLLLNMRR